MKKNDIFRDLLTCHGLLYLIVLLLTGFRFDYALASPLNDHGSRAVQKMKKYSGAVNPQLHKIERAQIESLKVQMNLKAETDLYPKGEYRSTLVRAYRVGGAKPNTKILFK